jgi:hypothetical protein
MVRKRIAVTVAAWMLMSANVFASGYAQPIVMASETQLGDDAELRFDPTPANTGELVVVDKTTKAVSLKRPFSYDVKGGTPNMPRTPRGATVDLRFSDGNALTIACDPLSENCRSSDFVTEGSDAFSLSWVIKQE